MKQGIKFWYIKQSLNNYLQQYKMIYLQKKNPHTYGVLSQCK